MRFRAVTSSGGTMVGWRSRIARSAQCLINSLLYTPLASTSAILLWLGSRAESITSRFPSCDHAACQWPFSKNSAKTRGLRASHSVRK